MEADVPSRKKSAASQSCYSFQLQEEVNKVKEQLRESEAEIRQTRAELGRYLFLEDKEKRSGKLQLQPRAPTSDESRQYAESSSCNETSLCRRLLVEGTSLKRQPGPSLRTVFIDISNSLSAVEFQHMKDLAKGKVNDFKLARMKVPYQLLDELERVGEHPRTDIRELLEGIQRLDLLEKLGVSLDAEMAPVSPASLPLKDECLSTKDSKRKIVTRRSHVSVRSSALSGEVDGGRMSGNQGDSSCESFLSFESSAEIEKEIPASGDIEDYEGLPLKRVRTDGKEETHVSFTSDSSSKTGNQLPSQQNSCEPDRLIEESRESGAANSPDRNWESQGARPKRTQTQRPVDPPLWPSSSPVSDGLAKDFLARHSRDRSIQESLCTNDRGSPSLGPERLRDTSFVDGLTSVRPYFGTMGASSYERLGGAFSDVPSGGSVARAGLLGLLNGNDFATSDHSLIGEQRFSRERDSLLTSNFGGSRLSLQQTNTPIFPNSRFVYGSTSWDFAAGVHPGYSMYGAQRHVLSDGNANSVFSSTVAGDGNEETILLPVSSEVNFKDTSSNRDYGRNTVEPNDNSLAASEQRTAEDASALLREREEREEFMRELQRKEQMIREERERERRENEDRGWQEAERWPPQQEGVSTGSRWLCEHYQRRCRVRFPCCTQFYPCHRCHNSSSNCKNDEAKACHATHLKCSLCQFEQEIDENSGVCRKCGGKMAAYFCSICKHFTSVDKNPYHCDQCGICRIHKDKWFHCKVCNECLDELLENNHKCPPDSGDDKCCIC